MRGAVVAWGRAQQHTSQLKDEAAEMNKKSCIPAVCSVKNGHPAQKTSIEARDRQPSVATAPGDAPRHTRHTRHQANAPRNLPGAAPTAPTHKGWHPAMQCAIQWCAVQKTKRRDDKRPLTQARRHEIIDGERPHTSSVHKQKHKGAQSTNSQKWAPVGERPFQPRHSGSTVESRGASRVREIEKEIERDR